MRHLKKKKTLDRARDSRRLLLRGLLVNFALQKSIKTTQAKAKVIRPLIENLITHAKPDTLEARRYLLKKLNNPRATDAYLKKIAPQYKERRGGYTRITKLGYRAGDNAPVVKIELI